ncbi:MAG: DMT family transporter [Beijerinckiaceae bacterium]|jgi:drug/metabolite transporter (DMT)-like permease|nr:DMT family transporter [Beijerinckiaceae bacterium]
MMVALGGYLIFAGSVRSLREELSLFELVALRALGGLLFCMLVVSQKPALISDLRSINLPVHALRSLLHALGTLAIVGSILMVPLGIVSALEFTGPIFAAGFVLLFYRLGPSWFSALGLAAIAAGAFALLSRHFEHLGPAVLLPLLGTVILTGTNMMLARLAARHRTTTILLVMSAIQLPLYAICIPLFGTGSASHEIGLWQAFAILGVIASGIITQTALANASRHGTDVQLSALDTLRIPAVAIMAYLVFSEMLDATTLVLMGVIMCGAAIVAFGRRSAS